MMAHEALLDWAAGRPLWQQDALRRLAQHGELTEDDFADLRSQIEIAQDLPAENPPEATPLAAEHLSEAASDEPKTVLASLGPVKNIDRLESDQPPMRFAVNGITLVYGPNASGKSGYCRITKQLCRSLTRAPLRGNIYSKAKAPAAEIGLGFRVGDDAQPKTEIVWKGSDPPPSELARISVFDTATARVYVDKERKIEFLPYELDRLNKLGVVLRALDGGFKTREDALNAAVNVPLPAGYTQDTAAYRLVSKLTTATPLDDLPSEQALRDLANWSAENQAELDRLTEESKNDPQTLARLRTEARQALETLEVDVATIQEKLADAAIAALSQKRRDAVAKSAAAEASAHDLFKDEPIPDVGSEVWRQMLKYAREFAASAFPDRDPPQIATAERCVLCQQELDEPAAARLAAFDAYLTDRAAEEAAIATQTFNAAVAAMLALTTKTRANVTALLAGYAALSPQRKDHAETFAAFFEKAAARLRGVKAALTAQQYDNLDRLEALPDSPAQLIDDEIAALKTESDNLNNAKRDDAAAQQRAARLADLTDRKKLSEEIEVIVERRNRLEERHKVAACRSDCRVTAITQQITRRRREILTPTLKQALKDELSALHLTHIPLGLADRGDLGSSIVEIALSAQQRIANNSDVLSEGEQRGLALACFLAELNEVGRDHGIIIDDPVSSLDHSRMESVAGRLAQEAANGRQVIVFTHNILFHYMLSSAARRAGVACHEEWMTSLGNNRFGIIDNARKPWHVKPVTERLTEIEQTAHALKDAGYDRSDEKFRSDVAALYTQMRTTWERIVEEILFNKTIQRFRPEIMTQSLKAACFDTENDYPVIFEGMKRTSHYSGHDLAEDLPPELPASDDIDQDLAELRKFATFARDRRKALEKSTGEYEAGVEPILL
jgi:energy-coupling factor transporter ATP-binding protein EcfA2